MKPCVAAVSALLLLSLAFTSEAATAGPLRVGAARVDVTPAPGDLPKHYLGVNDRVYSRAIVIDNGTTSAALVTVDVISFPNALADRLTPVSYTHLTLPTKRIV